MSGFRVSVERARFFSVVGAFALSAVLLAFLFHTPASVTVDVEAPAKLTALTPLAIHVTVPAGQWLPVAGQTAVLESAGVQPTLIERASCWSDASCDGGLVHATRPVGALTSIVRGDDGAVPSEGKLWVRSEGYGRSDATGYGQEIEPERSLYASDLADEEGVGNGYGHAEQDTTLEYLVHVDAAKLPVGTYQFTFLVETGSAEMGPISSPRVQFQVEG